jgi:hypothetical protein
MWFLLFFQPYEDYSDNLVASITQLQLFLTLWLGILIQLNDLNEESLINESLLSALLVGTCCAVTIFGVGMIVSEGIMDSRRAYREEKNARTERVRQEVRKRWSKVFNFVSYESQVERFGGLSFSRFNIPAMMEAFRRTKLGESNKFDDQLVRESSVELRLEERFSREGDTRGEEEEEEQMISYVNPRYLKQHAE